MKQVSKDTRLVIIPDGDGMRFELGGDPVALMVALERSCEQNHDFLAMLVNVVAAYMAHHDMPVEPLQYLIEEIKADEKERGLIWKPLDAPQEEDNTKDLIQMMERMANSKGTN